VFGLAMSVVTASTSRWWADVSRAKALRLRWVVLSAVHGRRARVRADITGSVGTTPDTRHYRAAGRADMWHGGVRLRDGRLSERELGARSTPRRVGGLAPSQARTRHGPSSAHLILASPGQGSEESRCTANAPPPVAVLLPVSFRASRRVSSQTQFTEPADRPGRSRLRTAFGCWCGLEAPSGWNLK